LSPSTTRSGRRYLRGGSNYARFMLHGDSEYDSDSSASSMSDCDWRENVGIWKRVKHFHN
jgi:hypothetical protein